MKKFFAAAVLIAASACGCAAQSFLSVEIAQNPVFEVSANKVEVAMPETGMTLGGDLVIKGGSGTYKYLWTNADGAELGTESTLNVTDNGVYTLRIEDTCDCAQTVNFYVNTSGLDNVYSANVSISPNPTTGRIEIAGFDAIQIAVVSVSGKMVALFDSADGYPIATADISHLSAGEYILTLADAAGARVVAKIIKL